MDSNTHSDDPLQLAEIWFAQNRKLALITVLSVWGSAPRPAGSHMICDDQGDFAGSVSGGCIEAEVIAQAADIIRSGKAGEISFGISDETAWTAGLSCGGIIRLLITPYDTGLNEAVRQINHARDNRQAITTVIDLQSGALRISDTTISNKITVLDETSFSQTYRPKPRLVVIGAVHIAQALAPMARITSYDLTVLDPRTGFATPARFPDTTLNTTWPEDYFVSNPPDAFTAIIAISHIPHIDDPALIAGLTKDCFYVGALGSRKSHAKRLERLALLGLTADDCARIHAPIGLAIGAQEPAEIAAAILAEIIQAYRKPE